jgi:predicted phage tail protein
MKKYQKAIILEAALFVAWALILTTASSLRAQTPTPTPTPSATPAIVSKLNIAWDPSPDTTVVKYNVYVSTAAPTGTPPNQRFTNPTAFQVAAPATAFTFTNLADGRYWLTVTAANGAGLESFYSNIVQVTVQSTPPPPVTGLRIVSQTVTPQARAAKIGWQTDSKSKGKVVLFGPGQKILQTQSDKTTGTNHSVRFTGLKKGAAYTYQIQVKTPTGGAGPTSVVQSFTL